MESALVEPIILEHFLVIGLTGPEVHIFKMENEVVLDIRRVHLRYDLMDRHFCYLAAQLLILSNSEGLLVVVVEMAKVSLIVKCLEVEGLCCV